MVLLPITAGYAAGPERGACFGFAAGLVADLFLPTPFGLSALVGCLLGFGTGLATAGLVRGSWWMPPVVAAVATAAGLGAYAILGAVLGQPAMLRTYLAPALVIGVPSAALFAIPVLRMVTWALPTPVPGHGAATPGGVR
jgi:cell shape-determining protein MreD